MAWGYRAMFVLLHTYRVRHGCDTLRKMINRYAPPSENHTDKYIVAVATRSSIPADQKIDTGNPDVMIPIVAAMSFVENGVPARMDDVTAGWNLFIKYSV